MNERTINVDKLLDYVTENVYDSGHGLLSPVPTWVIDTMGLLDFVKDQLGISTPEMTKLFDDARVRVHGEGAKVP